jgi:hypothetical protein
MVCDQSGTDEIFVRLESAIGIKANIDQRCAFSRPRRRGDRIEHDFAALHFVANGT